MNPAYCEPWTGALSWALLVAFFVYFLVPRAVFWGPLIAGVIAMVSLAAIELFSGNTPANITQLKCNGFHNPVTFGVAAGILLGGIILGVKRAILPPGQNTDD